MTPTTENLLALDGFEFVEFASPEPGVLERVFGMLRFAEVARHRSKDVGLYPQGGINFVINREPKSSAAYFAEAHGAATRPIGGDEALPWPASSKCEIGAL